MFIQWEEFLFYKCSYVGLIEHDITKPLEKHTQQQFSFLLQSWNLTQHDCICETFSLVCLILIPLL